MDGDSPLALLLACLVSGLLVPLPEDVALLVAGWRLPEHGAPILFAAGFAGTLGRDLLAFGLGSLVGPRIERLPRVRALIGEARLARAHALFETHGSRMLFATRFAIGLRAPLYFVGGSLGFSARRLLLLDTLGLLFTVPFTLWLGARFGADAAGFLQAALGHQRVLLATAVVLAGGWWLLRGRRTP